MYQRIRRPPWPFALNDPGWRGETAAFRFCVDAEKAIENSFALLL